MCLSKSLQPNVTLHQREKVVMRVTQVAAAVLVSEQSMQLGTVHCSSPLLANPGRYEVLCMHHTFLDSSMILLACASALCSSAAASATSCRSRSSASFCRSRACSSLFCCCNWRICHASHACMHGKAGC